MSDFLKNEKRRRRALTSVSALLALTLSLGVCAACGGTGSSSDTEKDDTPAPPADTQIVKNGNFEFYSEMMKDFEDKRSLISTPNDWSFTQGNPTSNTHSGIVVPEEWAQLTSEGHKFTSVADAYQHFEDEGVTAYDRLKFFDEFKDEIDDLSSKSAEKKLFDSYAYSPADFEDVENLKEEVGEELVLHPGAAEDDKGVLMIHNERSSDNVLGTAQYYQMSSAYTLAAGSTAKLSVWVRTEALYHYGDPGEGGEKIPVEYNAGAYISVTTTVGGSKTTEMQIKNIVTSDTDGENTGWRKYELIVRGNAYATSTFRIKLGLGQGSSDNRLEGVDGYAFFDDLECTILPGEDYDKAVKEAQDGSKTVKEISALADNPASDLLLDATKDPADLYAIDMLEKKEETALSLGSDPTVEIGLTEADNGWTSERKGYTDNRELQNDSSNIGKVMTYGEIKNETTNRYLTEINKNHFAEKFPFGGESPESEQVVMILSATKAAYTAKIEGTASSVLTVQPDHYLLLTFFVKTSEMRSGRTGAGAKLVDVNDPTNSAAISSFDTTTVDPVDINDDYKDIYKGWVQCTFFIANETEEARSVRLELTYGPTDIANAADSAYGEGWAAFTGFKTREIGDDEYSYVTKGDRAKELSLSDVANRSAQFDQAGKVRDIEKELAHPANFSLVTADSRAVIGSEGKDVTAKSLEAQSIYTGLLSSEYAKNYATSSDPWKQTFDRVTSASGEGDAWWNAAFKGTGDYVAHTPLVLLNGGADSASVGYYLKSGETLSANSTRRISVRVKVSAGQKAYLYLVDTSDVEKGYNDRLTPAFPSVTYWYDDDGNLCGSDPTAEDYDEENEETGILYEIQPNGLYKKKGATDDTYYANLSNYEENDEGNLTASDNTVVFYGKKDTGGATAYYAYYDDTKTGDARWSTPVKNFPEGTPTRYTAPALTGCETAIELDGDKTTDWVTVSFFLRTGNKDKTFRLEVWAGDRSNQTDGFKANGYVFFDNYLTTSDYDTYLESAKEMLEEKSENLVDPDAEEKHLTSEHALYYTFTFFDSASYVRYDENLDEEGLGNHWASYKQSEQEEGLVYLEYTDLESEWLSDPSVSRFFDYSLVEKTVEKDDLGGDTDTSGDTDDESSTGGFDWANLLLIISSVVLALVLLAVIGILIGRKVVESLRKSGKLKPKAEKPAKKARPVKAAEPAPAPAKKAPEKDENDPYNE